MTVEKAKEGVWYLGAFGHHKCSFSLTVNVASTCPHDCHSKGECVKEKCVCSEGFAGESCQIQYTPLASDLSISGSVAAAEWAYYSISITELSALTVTVTEDTSQPSNDCDLYLSLDRLPNLFDWDYANVTDGTVSSINLRQAKKGKYFLGVLGYSKCVYNVTLHTELFSDSNCRSFCSLHGNCVHSECKCHAGFTGELCDQMDDSLSLHEAQIGYVSKGGWNYYNTRILTQNALHVLLTELDQGDCDLYVRSDKLPNQFEFDFVDLNLHNNSSVTIHQPGDHTWFIGVFGFEDCKYSLKIEETIECSCMEGVSHGKCLEGSHDCFCDAGWTGEDCTVSLVAAHSGEKISSSVKKFEWSYYYIFVNHSSSGVLSLKESGSTGFLWLFVSFTGTPSLTNFDFAEKNSLNSVKEISLSLSQQHARSIVVGVYGSPYISRPEAIPFEIILWISPF